MFEFVLLQHGGAQLLITQHDPIAALSLGLVHCEVGITQELVGRRADLIRERYPDTCPDPDGRLAQRDGGGDGLEQTLGKPSGLGGADNRLSDDNELVTTQPSDVISRPDALEKPRRGGLEHEVTRRMTELVVHDLEAVKVDEDDSELSRRPWQR